MRSGLRLFAFVSLVFATTAAFAAARGASLDGTLLDQSGKPLAGAMLTLHNADGKVVTSVTSDPNGHYVFSSVDAGSYVVDATKDGGALGSMTVTIGKDPIHQDFALQAAASQAMNIVISHSMDEARNNLSPHTGTNAYKIDDQSIDELPTGDDTSLDKVLEQAPGVAEDSYGQVHVRGEHANLQYRVNGIYLPEGISGFGQTLDPALIQSMTLYDGALPAQYGFQTAGVVDIQTKDGFDNSGSVELRVGSYGTIQPTVSYGGTFDTLNYFFTASHLEDNIGIEQPTSSSSPIHDHTDQTKEFGYASYMIDPDERVEMIAGNSISNFQIPNNPGQVPQFTYNGTSTFNSANLNENQFESNQYASLAWQGQNDRGVTLQIAPYIRQSETHYEPDTVGDLIFNGIASNVEYTDIAVGIQNDNSWRINSSHTLRAGFQIQDERVATFNTSQVFPGSAGAQTSDIPETIVSNSALTGQLYGVYLQDEWKLTDQLTMNYGARFDDWASYVNEDQLSPRLGFVYKANEATTLHAGYARYFTPPPLELVAQNTVAAFAGTTGEPAVALDAPVKAERTHSFDMGATHQLTEEIKLGVDAYLKLSHDLLDEGQFGQAVVYTPFNYDHGKVYGIEFTGSYDTKNFSAYGNLALSRAVGEDIVSSQLSFADPAELAYIQNNYVHLDHDQTVSASAGVDYKVLEHTKVDADTLFGSGLREGFANEEHLDPYVTFDVGVTQDLDLFPHDKTSVRFSIVNLLDTPYELRSGTGIGVGAPQWGERRGFYFTLKQGF